MGLFYDFPSCFKDFITIHEYAKNIICITYTGYSNIKIRSVYKSNGTHLKPTVLIRQVYLKTIYMYIHEWNFYPVIYLYGDALSTEGSTPNFHMDLAHRQKVS